MLYYLSVIAIFKNEKMAINEWLDHYISEGVEHFYLIDNDSDDNYKINEKYYNKIDIVFDKIKHEQQYLYNFHFLDRSKNESEWVIIVDLDEFLYAKEGTIYDYLKSLPDIIEQVSIPWKIFGSSGFIHQPDSIVNNFIYRCKNEGKIEVKSIIRTKYLIKYNMHNSIVKSNNRFYIDRYYVNDHYLNVDENLINQSILQLNHYIIQSFEYFRKIKMTRGAADTIKHNNIRDIHYFNEKDKYSDIIDNELRYKKYKNKSIINNPNIVVYGVENNYKDISNYYIDFNSSFNDQFGDPIKNKKKYLIIRYNNILVVFDEI
jgi:hypothetical protein